MASRYGLAGSQGDAQASAANQQAAFNDLQLDSQERAQFSEFNSAEMARNQQAEIAMEQLLENSAQRQGQLGVDVGIANQTADIQQQMALDASNQFGATNAREYEQMNRSWRASESGLRQQQAALASDLGGQYDQRQLTRISEMERAGASRRELDQAVLDMSYENYMRRTNWAQDQLNWLQGILSGAPAQQQTYTTAPGPSPVSELLGLGLAGGMAGNLFSGGGSQPAP